MKPDSSARKALAKTLITLNNKFGRPPITWLKKIKEELKPLVKIKLGNEKAIRELEKMTVERNS